jgi:hypothetical protein
VTQPLPWESLRRVAELFHLELDVSDGKWSRTAVLSSTIGAASGLELVRLTIGDLDDSDADRVLRAVTAAALVQLGPGATVGADVIEQAAHHLELTADQAGELAHLAALLDGTDTSLMSPTEDLAQRAAIRAVLDDEERT